MNKDIIYGINAIKNIIINKPEIIEVIYIQQKIVNKKIKQLLEKAKYLNINCLNIEKKIKGIENYPIICKIKINNEPNIEKIKLNNKLILILDEIKDPQNLGSCIRTAEAANVDALIITKKNTTKQSPLITEISCGSNLIIPIINTDNIINIIKYLKHKNILIVGTSIDSNKTIYEENLTKPMALIIGSEEKGIKPIIKKNCDLILKIPILGKCGSLNLSVTTGIILFEIQRQKNIKIN